MRISASVAVVCAVTIAGLPRPASAEDPKVGVGSCLKAAQATKAGQALKVEFKDERGTPIYDFGIRGSDGSQWEIECDGNTGKIIEVEQQVPGPDDPKFKAKLKLSESDARKAALAAHPGQIIAVEYEIEPDGAASYEFDIKMASGKEMKAEVDATTGKIVEANEELWQIGPE